MKNLIYLLIIFILLYIFYKCYTEEVKEGFTPFKVLTDYDDISSLNLLIQKVIKIFHENKFQYWACFGTLLGAVRDKGIIPWDDDADFCFMESDTESLMKMKSKLKEADLGLTDWFGGYKIYDLNGKKIKDKDFNYPFIDLFAMVKNNDRVELANKYAKDLWPEEFYTENELYPLKLYDFEGYKIYGPNNSLSYLDRQFPDWKIKGMKTYNHVTHKKFDKTEFPIEYDLNEKPYLWQYWEGDMPSYIKLSMNTVDKHCSKSFDIVRLNKDNIYNYLPEMKEYESKLRNLLIAQRVDIYRIMLLYKYGGIYIDADIVVLRDPIEVIEKLKKYEFVGFGCTGGECDYGYGEPSNWILSSRPNSHLMGRVLKNLLEKISSEKKFEYHDLGKNVIWDELKDLIQNYNYEYYHYPNKYDGSRDKNKHWITSNIAFSNAKIEYENEANMLFFVYYNSNIPDNYKKITEQELLSKDWNITRFIKRSLEIN